MEAELARYINRANRRSAFLSSAQTNNKKCISVRAKSLAANYNKH